MNKIDSVRKYQLILAIWLILIYYTFGFCIHQCIQIAEELQLWGSIHKNWSQVYPGDLDMRNTYQIN